MAGPVFGGTPQAVKGVIKADDVKLTGFGSDGAVVQQLQISFERSMNMLYEIGSSNVYYVGDRRKGQIQGSRVVAGSGSFRALIQKYGNICDAKTNSLTLTASTAGCGVGVGVLAPIEYDCQGVVLTSIGASVTAQDIVITENIGFQFVEMNYT